MELAGILILALFIASALLLVLVVLIQDDQGEGIGGMFGGGESSSPFGSRTGNVLTKFTTILGGVFLVCAFSLAWINRTPDSEDLLERARLQTLDSEAGQWWVRPEPAPVASDAAPRSPQQPAEGSETDAAPSEQGSSAGTVGQAEAGDASGGGSTR